MRSYHYIITVNKGLEEISAAEVYEITGKKPIIENNILRLKGEEKDAYRLIIWGRTIHRVLLLIDEGEFTDLEDLSIKLRKVDLRQYYKKNLSFALKTSRYGVHNFTSIDVNRVIGGLIHDVLSDEGLNPTVNLSSPDIQFIMRIVYNRYMLTLNLTGESLHVRGYRVFNHPASIKTSIAASMIYLSRWNDEDFIDPMGGGGTIPIEAAMIKYRYPPGIYRPYHPLINVPLFNMEEYFNYREEAMKQKIRSKQEIELVYNDVSPSYLDGAMLNAMSADVSNFISFYNLDARSLTKYGVKLRDGFVTVSNPPYGIRMTRHRIIPQLYEDVISELVSMGCSRFVMITSAWKSLLNAFEHNGVNLLRMIKIKHGNLDTFILYGEI